LNTTHNLYYYMGFMKQLREAIRKDRLQDICKAYRSTEILNP